MSSKKVKRGFEYVRKIEDGSLIVNCKGNILKESEAKGDFEYVKQYEKATLPVYSTKDSVGCDLFCAETVVIPPFSECQKTVLVHTGIKVFFPRDEAFLLLNRSSTPKYGLILANGVGLFESDYYNNPSNDGEILIQYINMLNTPVTVEVGQKIAQGTFVKIKRAKGSKVLNVNREGGIGFTGR